MTYQALARKWRPRTFQALVGQSHIVDALVNALTRNTLHHAFLFTGTRGVGKTSLGRILARCLNCETGVTATPCGTCNACVAINEGRFVDLIEVDAASRTKVEDTRELLDNVQYRPTQGRFKIYLIDEVHMLSGHSFNALLKTLEEPPEYVKFILATTDPEKLPITVLSRCLRFHLRALPTPLIAEQLGRILNAESIPFEQNALNALAESADGSMRDALSLLDQAIALGNGHVKTAEVNEMLGTIDYRYITEIIDALITRQGTALLDVVEQLQSQSIDYLQALDALIHAFHQLSLFQVVGRFSAPIGNEVQTRYLETIANDIPAETIQLFYQIALHGRRDCPLAPTLRLGFEMTLLRLLAFYPVDEITKENKPVKLETIVEPPKPKLEPKALSESTTKRQWSGEDWETTLQSLELGGITHALAANCVVQRCTEHELVLALSPAHAPLNNPTQQQILSDALSQFLGRQLKVSVVVSQAPLEVMTPAKKEEVRHSANKEAALTAIQQDDRIAALKAGFQAEVIEQSLKITS